MRQRKAPFRFSRPPTLFCKHLFILLFPFPPRQEKGRANERTLQQEMRKERGKKDEREGERSRDGGRKEAFFPEEKAPLAVCAIFLLPLLLPLPFFSLLSLFLLLRRCHQR